LGCAIVLLVVLGVAWITSRVLGAAWNAVVAQADAPRRPASVERERPGEQPARPRTPRRVR